jgi:hypothetical protein
VPIPKHILQEAFIRWQPRAAKSIASPQVLDASMGARLWELSERLVQAFPIKTTFTGPASGTAFMGIDRSNVANLP